MLIEGGLVRRQRAGFMRLRSGVWVYFLCFTALTVGGLATLMLPSVEIGFTRPFTRGLVAICESLMRLFGAHVHGRGVLLAFDDGSATVMVANGCNALEVSILLASALLAFPAPLAARIVGIIGGVGALQAINVLRIISLLLIARIDRDLFNFFHVYLWDSFIMLDSLMLLIGWNAWQARRWPSRRGAQSAA